MDSKHYACIFSALYVALVVLALLFIVFEPRPQAMQQSDVMYIEFIEPPTPPEPKVVNHPKASTVPVPNSSPVVKENPPHETPSPVESTMQSGGPAEETKTGNQRALFQMAKEGVDEPADVGNRMAKVDTVISSAGAGQGLSQYGDVNATIDAGLKGRGSEYVPRPNYPPGNREGIVVVRVIVNPDGKVVLAEPISAGTTTSDAELRAAAKAAALKARFKKIEGLAEISGTITYRFRLK